jgi:hypothetical protein
MITSTNMLFKDFDLDIPAGVYNVGNSNGMAAKSNVLVK